MELPCLSRSTRLPAVLGGFQTLPRVPGCSVHAERRSDSASPQSAALRGEGCDRPGVTRQSTIHDSFPSIRAGEATRPDSALIIWH